MVEIKEALPNPIGKDTDGEYITLTNKGVDSVNLSGWKIKDLSGKTFSLTGYTINPNEDLKLLYKTTKISLNNDKETIFLQNEKGEEIDKLEITSPSEGEVIKKGDKNIQQVNSPLNKELIKNISNTKGVATIQENNSPYMFIGYGLISALLLSIIAVYSMKKFKYFHEEGEN
ncbi:MAG: hypothetical protein COU07_03680 [Candidatus Harrisonbacteria bacterium CG10_big_fil_rev_8_21_14_0_10_40_38]|uniref:LTD domain-containing protein n=1 Tax=Candidatus Harrisonbacteria bacterium CG10_big_fil_rev_8_21_14_0_10_40_38 TaxID=1974583 RepID=A0A2H0URF9_9BACT|nr:MAG: hypothetical protein COU07_03680 [Candidatus Harrisonbacteria bacterium CG10_big_fil_rev_8_21_14_0_10_40_38]